MAWLPTEYSEVLGDGSVFLDFTNFNDGRRPTHVGIFHRGVCKLEVEVSEAEDMALAFSEMAHKADELFV